jgi:hypothetical protein
MLQLTKQDRFSLPFMAVLTAILLTMSGAPAQANSPAAPPNRDLTQSALAGGVSPEGLLNPDGTLDMSTGFQGTLDLRGWEVILDGERGPVLKPASRPAAPQVTAWNGLPNQGLGGGGSPSVGALAVVGSDLYVGGAFTQTGDGALTNLGSIARYDTTAGTWNALPNQGLDGYVYALAVSGSDLYVGGFFDQTGDGALTNLGSIARYDTTAGTWNALPNQGLDNTVIVLSASGSDLYVGGYFTETGDGALTNLGCIARYDTTVGTWNALPNQGLSGGYLPMPSVHALAVVGSDLYVGGNFTRTGDGALTNLGRIARYDTTAGTWNPLPNQGLGGGSSPDVYTLAVVGSDLYVGGHFTQTGDALTNLGRIARYDTTAGTWNPLPNQGLNNDVSALAVVGSDLYVGGHFTQTGDALTNLGRIARYDTTAGTWNPLPNQGLNNDVRALAVSGSDLYVGGAFTQTGDGALTNLGYIARGGAYDNVYLPLYLPFVTRNWTPTPTPTPCPQFRAGTWHGFADFTVPSDRSRVENFTVDWYTGNCGTWHINEPELPINNCRIEFETSGGGAIRLSIGGTFTSEEEMQGSAFVLTSQCLASGTWWSWWVSGTE